LQTRREASYAKERMALERGIPLCMICHVPAVKGLVRAWTCPKCGYAWG